MEKQEIKDKITTIIVAASPNYITADEIYARLKQVVDPGRTQETIRQIIRELVNEDESLIGSSSKGYFYIDSEERLEEAVHYLISRIPFLERRAETLRRLWNDK